MATNSATTAVIVAIGAFTDFIVRGEWTWRSFVISMTGAFIGFFASVLIVYFFASSPEIPEMVRLAITFFCGLFTHAVMHRVNKMTLRASIGGVSVESQGDEK